MTLTYYRPNAHSKLSGMLGNPTIEFNIIEVGHVVPEICQLLYFPWVTVAILHTGPYMCTEMCNLRFFFSFCPNKNKIIHYLTLGVRFLWDSEIHTWCSALLSLEQQILLRHSHFGKQFYLESRNYPWNTICVLLILLLMVISPLNVSHMFVTGVLSSLVFKVAFSRICESTTGYTFTPCVGSFTSPGIDTR